MFEYLEELEFTDESIIRAIVLACIPSDIVKENETNKEQYIKDTIDLYANLQSLMFYMVDSNIAYFDINSFNRAVNIKSILNYHPLESFKPVFSLCVGCCVIVVKIIGLYIHIIRNEPTITLQEDLLELLKYLYNYIFRCVKYFFIIQDEEITKDYKNIETNMRTKNMNINDSLLVPIFIDKYYKAYIDFNNLNEILNNTANNIYDITFSEHDIRCLILFNYSNTVIHLHHDITPVDYVVNIYDNNTPYIATSSYSLTDYLNKKIELDIAHERGLNDVPYIGINENGERDYPELDEIQ